MFESVWVIGEVGFFSGMTVISDINIRTKVCTGVSVAFSTLFKAHRLALKYLYHNLGC